MSTKVLASTPKQQVEHLLQQLPDDCTLEDVQEGLLFIQKLQERIQQAENATTWISQEEAEQRMAKWLTK